MRKKHQNCIDSKGGNVRNTFKRFTVLLLSFLLVFNSMMPAFAAITDVKTRVKSSNSMGTTVTSTVYASEYSDLINGGKLQQVGMDLFRDGNRVTNYPVTASPVGQPVSVGGGVYARDYEYTFDYSNLGYEPGNYSVAPVLTYKGDSTDGFLLKSSTVTGAVYLPSGVTAPGGGGWVYLYFTSAYATRNTVVYIPEGQNCGTYSISVPSAVNSPSAAYRISYNAYIKGNSYSGYYKDNNQCTTEYSQAALLDVSADSRSGVNLHIVNQWKSIYGTVSLPSNLASESGSKTVYIYAENSYGRYGTSVSISAGQSSASYQISIPGGSGYKVSYSMVLYGLSYNGFYTSGGTTSDASQAELLDLSGYDASGISFTILSANTTATTTVTGAVYLPAGVTAPAGGIWVDIFAGNGYYGSPTVTKYIKPGDRWVDYTLYCSAAASYSVSYHLKNLYNPNNPGYLDQYGYITSGYYSSIAGTVTDVTNATIVDAPKGGKSGINLTLIPAKKIQGTISLPSKADAPFIYVDACPINPYNSNSYEEGQGALSSSVNLVIQGQSSVTYTVYAHPDYKYKVKYVYPGNDYRSTGYYSILGTVNNFESAIALDMSAGDKSGIDLSLLPAPTIPVPAYRKINGIISLPAGEVAPAGGISVSVHIDIVDPYLYDYSIGYLSIAEGQASVRYSMEVRSDFSYRVRYNIHSGNTDFITRYASEGYYSSSGTVVDISGAEILDMSSSDKSNINMTLIPRKRISGTISLPSGIIAPDDGIFVEIHLEGQIDGVIRAGQSMGFFINGGNSSKDFTFGGVESGVSYRLRYYVSSKYGYVNAGYYTDSGTTWNSKLATLIPVGSSDISGKNLSLLEGNILTGTVSTPVGYPDASIKVAAEVLTADGTWAGLSASKESIELDAGYAKTFMLMIPSDITYYRVLYKGSDTSTLENFVSRGYYSINGTVTDPNLATVMSLTSANNINLEVVPGVRISGTIHSSFSNNSLGYVTVYASKKGIDGFWHTVSSAGLYISGYSSNQFSLCVPANDEYRIYYSISSSYDTFPYITNGYYSNGRTVADSNQATLLRVGSYSTGISLDLIRGYKVSGTISLPSGMTAPKGGLRVSINSEKESISGSGDWGSVGYTTVLIPEGTNSIKYGVLVDQSALYADSNGPRIYYSISQNDYSANNLVLMGYLGTNGTVAFARDAVNLSYYDLKSYNTDFTIIPGTPVSGVISLPAGNIATGSGIKVSVSVGKILDERNNWVGQSYTSLVIPQGRNSVPYTIVVPVNQPAGGYRIYTRYDNAAADYLPRSFYAAAGSAPFISMGDLVDVSSGPRTDINISLLPYVDCSFNAVFKVNGTPVTSIVGHQNQLLVVSAEMRWNKSETRDVLLVAALYYKEGAMSDRVAYVSERVNMGETNMMHAGFKLPSDVAGCKVEAFVLDGTDIFTSSLQPLSNVQQLQ